MKQSVLHTWICTLCILLLPILVTTVLAMLQMVLPGYNIVWDIFCLFLTVAAWIGAVVLSSKGLLGKTAMGTELLLGAILFVSVACFALSFGMEQDILPYKDIGWALTQFFGTPCSVSMDGFLALSGSRITSGTAAMLTGCLYMAVSLGASFACLWRLRSRKK